MMVKVVLLVVIIKMTVIELTTIGDIPCILKWNEKQHDGI